MEQHTNSNGILQFFLDLLKVIGGNIHTGKITCYLLFHRRSGGKSTLLKIHHDHPQIMLINPFTGEVNIVPIKENNELHRAL
jgi:hypothetical protein